MNIISLRVLWLTLIVLMVFGIVVESLFLATDGAIGPLTWGSTQALILELGGSDASNYLKIGLDLQDGHLTSDNLWILNLWPPGMTFLYTALLHIPGSVVPKMVVVSVVFWAFAGALVSSILATRVRSIIVVVFVLYWSFGTAASSWILGAGFLFSDGIGAALLIIFIALVFLAGERRNDYSLSIQNRVLLAMLGGLSLGISLYFRWAFLVVVVCAVALAVLGIFWFSFRRVTTSRRTRFLAPKRQIPRRFEVKVLAALGISVIVVVAPWTAYAGLVLHPGNPAWSTGDYQWAQRWLTDSQLKKEGANFLQEGGANWACNIARDRCLELNPIAVANNSQDYLALRDDALAAAAKHPIDFILNRLDFGTRAAFSLPGSSVGSFSGIGYGAVGAALFLVMGALLVRFFKRNMLFSSFLLITGGGLVAALGVAHFETRYLIPLTLVVGVSTFLLATNLRRLGQPRRGQDAAVSA